MALVDMVVGGRVDDGMFSNGSRVCTVHKSFVLKELFSLDTLQVTHSVQVKFASEQQLFGLLRLHFYLPVTVEPFVGGVKAKTTVGSDQLWSFQHCLHDAFLRQA